MSDDGARWARIAERGSALGLRITVGCYRTFGRPVALVLVHGIVAYFFVTGRGARRASRAWLRRVAATPEGARALGRPPDLWASFLHFRAFALSIFERVVLWLGREGEITIDASGLEPLRRLLAPDRGAIVVGAHLGSFDALRALATRDGRAVNVLMFTRHAPRINAVFRQLSPEVKVRVLEADPTSVDTVLRIRACVERGEMVAMLGDRVEAADRQRTCRVELFGDPVALPTAPVLLAGLLRCPLFFMVALRTGAARYRVLAEVLDERVELPRDEREKRVQELLAAYARRLEHHTSRAPYQWFNFYDFWNEEAA